MPRKCSLGEKKGEKSKSGPPNHSPRWYIWLCAPLVLEYKMLVQINSFLTHLLPCNNDANEAIRGQTRSSCTNGIYPVRRWRTPNISNKRSCSYCISPSIPQPPSETNPQNKTPKNKILGAPWALLRRLEVGSGAWGDVITKNCLPCFWHLTK